MSLDPRILVLSTCYSWFPQPPQNLEPWALIWPHLGHLTPIDAVGIGWGIGPAGAIAAYPVANGVWYLAMLDRMIPYAFSASEFGRSPRFSDSPPSLS